MRLRITSLLVIFVITVRGQNHSLELNAGTNYTDVYGYSFEDGVNTVKNIAPRLGLFINVTYLSLPMKHNWSFDQGAGLELRSFDDEQLAYFYTLNKYYTKRYFDITNNVYCFSFSFLFRHSFTNKISLAIGLLPDFIIAQGRGEVTDTNIITGAIPYPYQPPYYEQNNFNSSVSGVNTFGLESKIIVAYKFNQRFGVNFAFQTSVTNLFHSGEKDRTYSNIYKGGHFFTYSLGITYYSEKLCSKQKK